MKFEFVKEVSEPVPSYGGNTVKTGDVIELDGHLAEKAKANPDYRLRSESSQGATDPPTADDLIDLRSQWEAKFGKKPHHKKSAQTLREELNGD